MIIDTFSIKYQLVPHGTEETKIQFYNTIPEIFENLIQNNEQTVICTDSNVVNIPEVKTFLNKINNANVETVIIPAGEENKTIESVLSIIKAALDKSFTRNCKFIAIGGGVISDMTAFASSLYKRGAKLEIVPTTLLSMADACIGGKTGCDFDNYKNMIGTFYPASKLHFCPDFILSLPENEYLSGLAEVIKTAMLYAPKLFQILKTENEKIKSRNKEELYQIIKRCALAKSNIVEKDISETGLRKQLNLGHTFGHALESVAGFGKISHGQAVAWGLGRAIQLSLNLGLCEEDYKDDVFELLNIYGYSTEKTPKIIADQENVQEKLIKAMKQDKKNDSNGITFVLQREINSTLIEIVQEKDILAVL